MGKLKMLLMGLALVATSEVSAAWRVVVDPWTTAQVTANTSAQELIEDQHNGRLDSINAKQKKIQAYTSAMATIKELYKFSMQNINGFGMESKLYVGIFNTTVEIFKDIPVVFKTLNKFPGKNHLLCINEINNLVLETNQCAQAFKDIVTNGKVKSPIAKSSYAKEENNGDGYNFLDRYERYVCANKIYTRLREIQYRLEAIVFMCEYCNTFSHMVFNLDVDTWLTYFTAKNAVNGLISDWKGLSS